MTRKTGSRVLLPRLSSCLRMNNGNLERSKPEIGRPHKTCLFNFVYLTLEPEKSLRGIYSKICNVAVLCLLTL